MRSCHVSLLIMFFASLIASASVGQEKVPWLHELKTYSEKNHVNARSSDVARVVLNRHECIVVLVLEDGVQDKPFHLRHVPRDIALAMVNFEGFLTFQWEEGKEHETHYEAVLGDRIAFHKK